MFVDDGQAWLKHLYYLVMSRLTPSPQLPPQELRQQRWWRYLKVTGGWMTALLIAVVMQRYAFQSYQVFGQSMQPTLQEGDYLIISKLPVTVAELKHRPYQPQRGDIVVIKSPIDNSRLIKRVIGLPDERISITNGNLRVYNSEHPQGFDPYPTLGLDSQPTQGQSTMIVPLGNVYVVGDNRTPGGSLDSRNELGPVKIENVIGKLVFRLWPFSQIDTF